ncbi:MBL fold metallo-hydrolase [Thalassospira lucentensis]|uniref:MBL fold metallo-hydrolase n=1 Tax=Thalassospira lucentensis TaxID=168935 RepID=A0A358HTG2_9PROT|nr:MBL fold metallo-hydrolase [Thalassospira lucentensis]HBU98477.1 hypothetical protein [Thalassospira lucentensis]HCW66367.1 hypothetical protein [Thalassospira lucentensis]|tara:strand:+ start:2884 stop:4557 length:1674 start_codon:yes stop_codon:yes gene_type:complete
MQNSTPSNTNPSMIEAHPKSGRLNVKFVGARDGVSGSCSWLYHAASDSQFLVDCGAFQGADDTPNQQDFPFDPSALRFVLLTHAHIDHCGRLPKLVDEGFKGKVYATKATRDLTMTMLRDAVKKTSIYNESHIDEIKWDVIDADLGFKWGRLRPLADDLCVSFLRSSHILGASLVSIVWKSEDGTDRTICFSGDTGGQSEENSYLPLMKPGQTPFQSSNYIVTEATYGNRTRDADAMSSKVRTDLLSDIISRTVFDKKGKVIIPAFSLHRTQELIADIWSCLRKIKDDPRYADNKLNVLIDSPLGRKVTEVYEQHLFSVVSNGKFQYLNSELPEHIGLSNDDIHGGFKTLVAGERLKITENSAVVFSSSNPNERQTIEQKLRDNQIVLASSGMCDFGPVSAYLKHIRSDPKNTIIITGFQSPGTAGSNLLPSNIDPIDLEQNCVEVVDMAAYYSAHADKNQLLNFIFESRKEEKSKVSATVFINHGTTKAKLELAESIKARAEQKFGTDRSVHRVLKSNALWFDLENGEYLDEQSEMNQLLDEIERLKQELSSHKTK